MSCFREEDVTIEHLRLMGGGGHLRLIHRPSGISVDAALNSESVFTVRDTLKQQLRARVLAEGGGEAGEATSTSPGVSDT